MRGTAYLRSSLAYLLAGSHALLADPAAADADPKAEAVPAYLNPQAIVADAETSTAYVALSGTHEVAKVDLEKNVLAERFPVGQTPTGLALDRSGRWLAVTVGEAVGQVVLLQSSTGHVETTWEAGFSPNAPAFVNGGRALAVCNRFTDEVTFFEVPSGERLSSVASGREPIAAVPDASGARLYVGTHMPEQAATEKHVGLTVEIFDAIERRRLKQIDLPNGSSGLQDLALSPDGRWLFVTHVVGHYEVPTNQLERGWMNTNALSVIDTASQSLLGTALLDDTTRGAANPWGVGVTDDGQFVVVAHSGLHELSRIPLEALIENLRADVPGEAGGYRTQHDLTLMVRTGRARIPLPGLGPRALATAGSRVFVCEYFSGQLTAVDLATPLARAIEPKIIPLGNEPAMSKERQGELRFADARLCFQGWQSCLSCHPSVRADGLNWDLLNDGIGNPKQSKSLLFSHETPPAMAHGVRARAEVAVRAGIRFIQFAVVDETDAEAIDAYLRSLRPLPSPALEKGGLSASALRGEELFHFVGCFDCHNGEHYTDQELHRVQHATGVSRGRAFDTPTLREVWRTAPYLYDGRAQTIEEALRIKDRGVDDLSPEELSDLADYVRSL